MHTVRVNLNFKDKILKMNKTEHCLSNLVNVCLEKGRSKRTYEQEGKEGKRANSLDRIKKEKKARWHNCFPYFSYKTVDLINRKIL